MAYITDEYEQEVSRSEGSNFGTYIAFGSLAVGIAIFCGSLAVEKVSADKRIAAAMEKLVTHIEKGE